MGPAFTLRNAAEQAVLSKAAVSRGAQGAVRQVKRRVSDGDHYRNRMAHGRRGMAASFYAPIGKVKKWSWETTWAIAGFFSWILLPIGVSLILLPDFSPSTLTWTRRLFSRSSSSAHVGRGQRELRPHHAPSRHVARHRRGHRRHARGGHAGAAADARPGCDAVHHPGGLLTMAGIAVALSASPSSPTPATRKRSTRREVREFNVKLGLLLAVMCGIFSSGIPFAIDAATPIQAAALAAGRQSSLRRAAQLRHHHGRRRNRQLGLLLYPPGIFRSASPCAPIWPARPTLLKNGALAATGGIMWYLQFFFYAWGAANIPSAGRYVNWMLHMSIYVLCGGLVGLALGEWKGVGTQPVRLLWAGMLVIIAAANLVGLGMAS